MKCTLSNVIMFAMGAAVGALATWKFVKDKYERLANDEIQTMREFYNEKANALRDRSEETTDESVEEVVTGSCEVILRENGYKAYSDINKTEQEVFNNVKDKPYLITPDEYGEIDDYDVLSFTYYADGVLTDDGDEVMSSDEIEDTVGRDSLRHFGDHEADPDSVFVRNDRHQCDYEILFDSSTYADTHPQEVDE